MVHGGLGHGILRKKVGITKMVSVGDYYESIKREQKIRPIYECRCDERLKTLKLRNLHGLDHVLYTLGSSEHLRGTEHLKVKKRLIDEKFVSVMGESVI
jgi:hypothetical protein